MNIKGGAYFIRSSFSYDHGPVPHINKRNEVALTPAVLNTYTGKYKGPQSGEINVTVDKGRLTLHIGGKPISLFAEKEGLFFLKGRDLTFEFVKSGNSISRIIVHEGGKIVEELPAVH